MMIGWLRPNAVKWKRYVGPPYMVQWRPLNELSIDKLNDAEVGHRRSPWIELD